MAPALASALIHRLFEPTCPVCHGPIRGPSAGAVCAECWRAALRDDWTRAGSGVDSKGHDWTPFSQIAAWRSVGVYGGALRRIILAFKYGGHRDLGPALGALMREAGIDLLNGAVAAVPVPLWPTRGRARGFNQAEDLARALGIPVWSILRRRRPGLPQAALSAPARVANAANAYALSRPVALAQRLQPLLGLELLPMVGGTTLVLVDDVRATGATLEACATVLRQAGAREVRALVAARAIRRDQSGLSARASSRPVQLAPMPKSPHATSQHHPWRQTGGER